MSEFQEYLAKFQNLNCGRVGNHERPHKPVLLLAVLDLAESGRLSENRITLSPELLEVFRRYFDVVRTPSDQPTAINPFFFLRSDKFWHHQPQPGQEKASAAMRAPGSLGQLTAVISHSFLDEELYAALLDPVKREALRLALINRYFAVHRLEIMRVVERERQIGLYEQELERSLTRSPTSAPTAREAAEKEFGVEVRDAGFRRLVTRAYDYRCAACGLRVCLDDGRMLVEAAHLVPFAETQDDDPRNGMALCKNHHWAMDQFLIAPGTDKAWHVSGKLDDRLEGQQDLLRLHGRSILLPTDDRYHPRGESLQWRIDRLSGKN
jgi:putative restriction endonuclease